MFEYFQSNFYYFRLPDMSRTPTLSSTIDTRPIAITRVGAQSSMKTNTFTDNRVPAVIHRSTRRPMSTMDYQRKYFDIC